MKILIVLDEDTFKLDSISSESYRDGSIHYIVKYNKKFLERVIPVKELVEVKDFTFIKGTNFKDGTNYYKIFFNFKEYKFSPKEVFFS